MTDLKPIGIHKALADDTRYRLYRYLRLSGRAVAVRELATRLSLHPNTLRPHLRRLEEAGLVAREAGRTSGVGRPQTLYSAIGTPEEDDGGFRLVAEILAGVIRGKRGVAEAETLAREWGEYLVAQDTPKPGSRQRERSRNLAVLQDAMARAGFDPRFRRAGPRKIEVVFRDCPAKDLAEEHRGLLCAVHRGLVAGMAETVRPRLGLTDFEPFADRAVCRAELRA